MFVQDSRRTLGVALLALGVTTAVACATGTEVFGEGDGEDDGGDGGAGGDGGSTGHTVGPSGPSGSMTQGAGGNGGASSSSAQQSSSNAQSSSAAQSTAVASSAVASSSSGGMLGDCCMVNPGPGCNDPAVQACVCASDSFCCNNSWDQTCVDEVDAFGCGSCGGGGGMCCQELQSAGCGDPAVEACVCAFDDFCCTTQWDQLCADEVSLLGCGVCP
jgi:hypothetical protein